MQSDTCEDSDSVTEEDEPDEPESDADAPPVAPKAARAAAKAATEKALQHKIAALQKACKQTWRDMDADDRQAYQNAFLLKDDPIERKVTRLLSLGFSPSPHPRQPTSALNSCLLQVRDITSKARANWLYPMLKSELREKAAELVPFNKHDVESDRVAYKESKRVWNDYNDREDKWPRVCNLLFHHDEDGKPAFLWSNQDDNQDEDCHPFTAFVLSVAEKCDIAPADLKPNLVAFLAYIANQICGTKRRTRGHHASGQHVQGELRDRSDWNRGISKAMKFIKNREACPTRSLLILGIQRRSRL